MPSFNTTWHFKRDKIPCLKSQRTNRACLFQLYRALFLPRFWESRVFLHDNHRSLGNRGSQGIGRKTPLELKSGVSACSIMGLFRQGPGEITVLQEGPQHCQGCRWVPVQSGLLFSSIWACGFHGSLSVCHVLVLA